VLIDSIRNKKLGIFRPAVVLLGSGDFGIAERFAVRRMMTFLGGSTVTDAAFHDDQGRAVNRLGEDVQRGFQ